MDFTQFSLNAKLLRALGKLEFTKPTAIQEASLPILLSSPRDALIKSPTGSGKTLLYALTILQTLYEADTTGILGLVLVPSRELVVQVGKVICSLIEKSKDENTAVVELTGKDSPLSFKNRLETITEAKDPRIIVVSTPSNFQKLAFVDCSRLRILVLDEADLLLSFGYEQELNAVLQRVRSRPQTLMVSATLNSSLEDFRRLCLKNPAVIRLEDEDIESPICHYSLFVEHKDKPLVLLALLKLNLLSSSKILLFTNTLQSAYLLRLFLETFGLKSVVFHPRFPADTRVRIIEQVNRGKYELVICADEGMSGAGKERLRAKDEALDNPSENDASRHFTSVSRGIDFKNVPIVINYDVPLTADSYCHRVGRAGRASNKGLGLTLVNKSGDLELYRHLEAVPFSSFDFDIAKIEGFRYRVEDVLSGITKNRIKEAQAKDLTAELALNEKLKSKYDVNPAKYLSAYHLEQKDMALLNRQLAKRHLKIIPDYLLMHEGQVQSVDADPKFKDDLAMVSRSFKKRKFYKSK